MIRSGGRRIRIYLTYSILVRHCTPVKLCVYRAPRYNPFPNSWMQTLQKKEPAPELSGLLLTWERDFYSFRPTDLA